MNNNNMEKWVVCPKCQKLCGYTYAFNITILLIVIIAKEYLSGCISLCLLFKMLHQTLDHAFC